MNQDNDNLIPPDTYFTINNKHINVKEVYRIPRSDGDSYSTEYSCVLESITKCENHTDVRNYCVDVNISEYEEDEDLADAITSEVKKELQQNQDVLDYLTDKGIFENVSEDSTVFKVENFNDVQRILGIVEKADYMRKVLEISDGIFFDFDSSRNITIDMPVGIHYKLYADFSEYKDSTVEISGDRIKLRPWDNV